MGFFSKLAAKINGTAHPGTAREAQEAASPAAMESVEPEELGSATVNESYKVGIEVKQLLNSDSPSEQRFGWHKYLLEVLSSIKGDKAENLRHLSIYIRKRAKAYQWNDEAFKNELRHALGRKKVPHIGTSSMVIEIVSEKTFKRIAEKPISDTQYRQQFDDIMLLGSRKETAEQKFATAIDKREYVIRELLKKFRDSTGTDTKLMEKLVIVVVRNEDDDDMAKYDWVGKRFEDGLKRELANAFLERIGSQSLQIVFKPQTETDGCICLIENQVYYRWGTAAGTAAASRKEIPYERAVADIAIIEGTGSMMKPAYRLDSDEKKLYHIGRGVTSRKGGKYRINDIVINDRETNPELLQCNACVSSMHADIVYRNNKFYLQAAAGGCRACGGSPTKIVRDENATELNDTNLLYPLKNGDMIELGKSVLLLFSLSDEAQTD